MNPFPKLSEQVSTNKPVLICIYSQQVKLMAAIDIVYDLIVEANSRQFDPSTDETGIDVWASENDDFIGISSMDQKISIKRGALEKVLFTQLINRGKKLKVEIRLIFKDDLYFYTDKTQIPEKTIVVPKGFQVHGQTCELISSSSIKPWHQNLANAITKIWKVPADFVEDHSPSY